MTLYDSFRNSSPSVRIKSNDRNATSLYPSFPSHPKSLRHVSSIIFNPHPTSPLVQKPLLPSEFRVATLSPSSSHTSSLPEEMSFLRQLLRSRSSLSQTKPTRFFTTSGLASLLPTEKGKDKPRVVVLGTGWAGCRLMKGIDTRLYDVVCVSPRNHMVFTPLLASTCVGTLEFRSVAEPVSSIQPAISRLPGSYFFLSRCTGVDTDKHTVYM